MSKCATKDCDENVFSFADYCDDCQDKHRRDEMQELWEGATQEEQREVMEKIVHEGKLSAIKVAREQWQLSLPEAKTLVEMHEGESVEDYMVKYLDEGDRVKVIADHPHSYIAGKKGTVKQAKDMEGVALIEWDNTRSVLNGLPNDEEYVGYKWLSKLDDDADSGGANGASDAVESPA